MRADILDYWRDLIEAAEALDIDDKPLYVDFADARTFESGVMAMVLYKSRLSALGRPYSFALNILDNAFEISKVGAESLVQKK